MSNHRTERIDDLAAAFKALSNPHRLRAFVKLARCCRPGSPCCEPSEMSRCVGEIGEDLGIAPSTLSHHVKELQAAGLISCTRRGQNIDCCIDRESLRRLAAFFRRLAPDETPTTKEKP